MISTKRLKRVFEAYRKNECRLSWPYNKIALLVFMEIQSFVIKITTLNLTTWIA